MWPLVLLAIVGGYLVYKKTTPTAVTTPAQLPVAQQPQITQPTTQQAPQEASIYTPPPAATSPVVQTSNGGQSGIVQNPTPVTNQASPPVVHHSVQDLMQASMAISAPSGVTPSNGAIGSDGYFYTFDPGGKVITNPQTGSWIANSDPKNVINVYTPSGPVKLQVGNLFGLTAPYLGQIRT